MQPNEEVYISALKEVLSILKYHSEARLTKQLGAERVQDAGNYILGFIDNGVPDADKLSKHERQALTCLAVRSLIRYIESELHIPVTPKTITDSAVLVASAVEKDFPGYAEAKMLLYTVHPMKRLKQEQR